MHSNSFKEMGNVFASNDVDYEIITVGNKDIRGCIACRTCKKTGRCIFNDEVNEITKKFEQADGLVIGTPVYIGSANGTLISLLDRLIFSIQFFTRMKFGAAVISSRRAGNTFTFAKLKKYFTISKMLVASGRYWNDVHGGKSEEVLQDHEGLQNMRF